MRVLTIVFFVIAYLNLSVTPAHARLVCQGLSAGPSKVSGLYIDNFTSWHSIGKEAWLSSSNGGQLIFHVCSVDNTKNFLIAQNNPGNDFNPSKFSRFEWHEIGGQLYYCQQVFDADSAADASDFVKYPAADTSDVNDKGCGEKGKFSWSNLVLIRR